jgi:hypothetical protein
LRALQSLDGFPERIVCGFCGNQAFKVGLDGLLFMVEKELFQFS